MTQPSESEVGVGGDNKSGYNGGCKFDGSKISNNEDNGGNDEVGKKGQKPSKSKNLFKSKKR